MVRWVGRLVVFLLVGAAGYFFAGFAIGVVLAAMVASGNLSMADLSSATTHRLIEFVSLACGAALAWITVGRRYRKRRTDGRDDFDTSA